MTGFLGLPDLTLFAGRETWERVYLEAEPGLATCPKCGSSEGLSDPEPAVPIVVADTPSRGKPTEILITRWSYRCTPCARNFKSASVHVHQRRRMTHRAVSRHVV